MTKRLIVIVCGTALLIAAAVVVALRERQQAPLPEAPVAQTPAEVRVKAIERNSAVDAVAPAAPDASRAVAIVCGADSATADRYEARNDALRSIARRRDLPKADVDALMAYLRSRDDAMRVERIAAIKNDVMNLLRDQEPPVEGLAETLMGMLEGNSTARNSPTRPHPPAVLDYCVQHLGAMVNGLDEERRARVRGVLVKAAREKTKPYAGTALYSLAEDRRATPAQEGELKRLTLALCRPEADGVARVAAIQLAGQRGYAEALPILRETLSAPSRDAVLDMVSIGTLGLLGDESDIPLLESVLQRNRRRYEAAANAAIKRIKGREDIGTPTAGKEASLTLRPVLRVFQPHEGHFNRFWGSGAQPQFKKNFYGVFKAVV